MEISAIDLGVLLLYFGFVLYIGYFAMKRVNGFDDFSIAGRNVPTAIMFATIAATLCGGGATIGRVSFMHTGGLVVFFGTIGVIVNQFISGYYIAPKISKADRPIYGIGDIFGAYFGRQARLVSSIIAFFFCLSLFGVQILAMGRILQTAISIELIPAAIIASAITIAYTWSGGMLAVLLTDAIQYAVLAIGITLCAVLAVNNAGGLDTIWTTLTSNPDMAVQVSFLGNWTFIQLAGFFLAFLLGEFCAPYFIQRYASGKTPKETQRGVLMFSGYFAFFLATTAAIGLASMVLQPDIAPDLALTTLIRDTLPIGLVGLVFGALIAAVMSSGDSFINTASVIYTRDIYNEFINKKASQATLLKQSRIATIVIGVLAVIIAVTFDDVFKLMIFVFKVWPSAVLPPMILAIVLGKIGEVKISPYAAVPAMIAGGLTCLIWGDAVLGEPLGVPSNVIGIAANLIVLTIVHIATKNKKPAGSFLPEAAH